MEAKITIIIIMFNIIEPPLCPDKLPRDLVRLDIELSCFILQPFYFHNCLFSLNNILFYWPTETACGPLTHSLFRGLTDVVKVRSPPPSDLVIIRLIVMEWSDLEQQGEVEGQVEGKGFEGEGLPNPSAGTHAPPVLLR